MKNLKLTAALLSALMLVLAFAPYALANPDHGESITLLIDRAVKPESFFHIGRFFMPPSRRKIIVEVYNPVIRHYDGSPIEGLIIQTSSGRTNIPIDTVQKITLKGWIGRRTDDIPRIERTVNATILLTNGTQKEVLMNADLGTIEGQTDRGEFFLKDPTTIKCISFRREGESDPMAEE
jgi:hypothetical protein